MIRRDLQPVLVESAAAYPVVTLTGPRQSGKTTLCRATWPDKPYVSLATRDRRAYVNEDPRGFLHEHRAGVIIDEVQHAPDLLGYLQEEVDERPDPGRFVLTGSQSLALGSAVSQSLAGRTAVHHLLPPSLAALRRFPDAPTELFDVLWAGAFPRIHDRGLRPDRWLPDYVTTYIERDVRQILGVRDLEAFATLLRLMAGRSAQEVNLSALGGDAGLTHKTVRAWMSVLEASFLATRLAPWHTTVRKQLIKAPKLHFLDTGLVCHLLGIETAQQLRHHPLRGPIFESWVAAELLKQAHHSGRRPRLFHYRDARRLEVDLVQEGPDRITLVACKSGATVHSESWASLHRLKEALRRRPGAPPVDCVVVYGGDAQQARSDVTVLPWSALDRPR